VKAGRQAYSGRDQGVGRKEKTQKKINALSKRLAQKKPIQLVKENVEK